MTPDELAAKTAAIKAEWERKAAAGDAKARRLLRECYPEETEAVDAAAEALTHWSDGRSEP
jgi:hypothetical protein